MVCSNCGESGHNKASCPDLCIEIEEDSKYVKLLRPSIEQIFEDLGYGHTESIYHSAMKIVLQDLRLMFETEVSIPIIFRDRQIGFERADLIVNKELVIELKSINFSKSCIEDSIEQCKRYMRESGISNGLVIIFPKRANVDLQILPINFK